MIKRIDRKAVRLKKHKSIRKNVVGVAERPRLAVFRSLNHIYAQVIDDQHGVTLAAASSLDPEFKAAELSGGNIAGAQKVGELVAKKALDKGIKQVVFDRGGNLYHGRISALAESAREAGLSF
ncbi:ribosomal protein L18, bacterial type [Desulfosporosinus orientis DSM 765]|uniref:Large ribosomal subunit protein uL18 n=1 Tax=Desulfosporosinus orientis (strain ATCC 19365 / DSM 765 / NCIMB 8382 / VKM B-1628 / Singapore I) TaxID=768706 RepID=G7W9Y3_DESOD|nr:50S ribosomal protein L18 [Desulfosporosinus orientis]AET65979.1 ribosomal protein L18, bacterial type [Desulfosporosinus orientis DSM 765]